MYIWLVINRVGNHQSVLKLWDLTTQSQSLSGPKNSVSLGVSQQLPSEGTCFGREKASKQTAKAPKACCFLLFICFCFSSLLYSLFFFYLYKIFFNPLTLITSLAFRFCSNHSIQYYHCCWIFEKRRKQQRLGVRKASNFESTSPKFRLILMNFKFLFRWGWLFCIPDSNPEFCLGKNPPLLF